MVAVLLGLALLGLSFFEPDLAARGDFWMYLATVGLGLVFITITVKGWRIRSRDDIYKEMSETRLRLERLENWINK